MTNDINYTLGISATMSPHANSSDEKNAVFRLVRDEEDSSTILQALGLVPYET